MINQFNPKYLPFSFDELSEFFEAVFILFVRDVYYSDCWTSDFLELMDRILDS